MMKFLKPLQFPEFHDDRPADSLRAEREWRIMSLEGQYVQQIDAPSTRGRKRPVYRIDPAAPSDRSRWTWYPSVSAAFRELKRGSPRENSKPDVICQAIRHGWLCGGWLWDYVENKAGRLIVSDHTAWDEKTWDQYMADLRRAAENPTFNPDRQSVVTIVDRLTWKVQHEKRRARRALVDAGPISTPPLSRPKQ